MSNFGFFRPFRQWNRFLRQTWLAQEKEGLQSGPAPFFLPAKAWEEWKRQVPLVKAYYAGSSPFLPEPSLRTRPPRPALNAFVSFLCVAEDNSLALRALHYLVLCCRAFEADYRRLYAHPAGGAWRESALAREHTAINALQLVEFNLCALHFLAYFRNTYQAENPRLFAELLERCRGLARGLLAFTPAESEKLETLVSKHAGRHRDPAAEVTPLWKSWIADRVMARVAVLAEARGNKLSDLRRKRAARLEERREKARAQEEENRRQEEERRRRKEDEQRALMTTSLSVLHRRILKRCHPDLAKNPEELSRRHQIAVLANLAKDAEDRRTLVKLLAQLEGKSGERP